MEPVDTMEVLLKISEENRAVALKNKRKPHVKQKKEEKTQKKIKVEAETESSIKHERKIKHEKTEASSDTSKETSKGASEIQKLDYITVRARRGQATDIHNLAERVGREKISKKMKYLQDIVPGCNKVTEKAGMLDEIINYVQCLQRQVEFLSMKLAVLNPELELALEDVSVKQVKAHSVDHQNDIVIAQQLKGYEISISGLLYKCSCVEDSKQPIMVDVPLFPLDQQGSLDLSAINPNQTTSIEVTSIYETEKLVKLF